MSVSRPILRYHGGKWLLAKWIISHFPTHRSYVEPFGGAASVLLQKARSYAEVYNDLDNEVVNLFQVAREQGEELREAIRNTPFSRVEFKRSYEPSESPLEQARRTVVRSFMGFGSNALNKTTGFRANSNRSGTTPARDWANLPESYDALIDRLRGVVIENRDAKEVMLAHDSKQTLHYVDPPYVAETRDSGCDYKFELSNQEHEDLCRFLKDLKGKVVFSGYSSSIYDNELGGWRRVERKALADGARERTEVLWLNWHEESFGLFDH